jgi:hypothetical protein
MAWNVGDASLFASSALAKTLPSSYNRHQIHSGLLAVLGGELCSRRFDNLVYRANLDRNKGALVLVRNPEYRGEIAAHYKEIFLSEGWRCDRFEKEYIHKLFHLAASHGIRVCWLVMPLAPALQAAREQKGLDATFTQFIRSFQGYPNLVIVDSRYSGYEHKVFHDASHLDPQGAFVLSKSLGDILRHDSGRKLDGPRWVSLARYREQPTEGPLEDVRQTELALKQLVKDRR